MLDLLDVLQDKVLLVEDVVHKVVTLNSVKKNISVCVISNISVEID